MAKNPYIFPAVISQVFFMSDQASPEWKVIVSNKSRSRIVVGEREDNVFRAFGSPIIVEGMLPVPSIQCSKPWGENIAVDLEVPLQQV